MWRYHIFAYWQHPDKFRLSSSNTPLKFTTPQMNAKKDIRFNKLILLLIIDPDVFWF